MPYILYQYILVDKNVKLILSLSTPWRHVLAAEVKLHSFLHSVLVGGVSSFSFGRCTSGTNSGTRWIGGWVGPKEGLDVLGKRKMSCTCRHWSFFSLSRIFGFIYVDYVPVNRFDLIFFVWFSHLLFVINKILPNFSNFLVLMHLFPFTLFSPFIIIISIQPEGRLWQEPEPSQATGMALVHCILGSFLGVGCHCFPPAFRRSHFRL